jgi:hypothetical protein
MASSSSTLPRPDRVQFVHFAASRSRPVRPLCRVPIASGSSTSPRPDRVQFVHFAARGRSGLCAPQGSAYVCGPDRMAEDEDAVDL